MSLQHIEFDPTKHRQQSDILDEIKRDIRNDLLTAQQRAAHAKAALGRVLLSEQIGTAGKGEVARARAALSAAQTLLQDIEAVAMALPGFHSDQSQWAQVHNQTRNNKRIEKFRTEYEEQRQKFDREYQELAKNGKLIPAARALFEAASRARRVGHVRKYFKSIRGRPKGRDLQRF